MTSREGVASRGEGVTSRKGVSSRGDGVTSLSDAKTSLVKDDVTSQDDDDESTTSLGESMTSRREGGDEGLPLVDAGGPSRGEAISLDEEFSSRGEALSLDDEEEAASRPLL